MVCPTCKDAQGYPVEVPTTEIISGKQIGDKWITLTEQERDACNPASSKNMEIFAFVPAETIDLRYAVDTAFVGPDKAGMKAFHLLLKAMQAENRVAVTKITRARSKEKLGILRPFGKVLLLQICLYADELRDVKEVEETLPEVSEKELQMGIALLKQMEDDNPDLTKFKDTRREKLDDIIERKLLGQPITVSTVPDATPTAEDDLFSKLMGSITSAPATPAPPATSAPPATTAPHPPTLAEKLASLGSK
jgi:DNA end-binding protein Ku